jgi:hypothetical protein
MYIILRAQADYQAGRKSRHAANQLRLLHRSRLATEGGQGGLCASGWWGAGAAAGRGGERSLGGGAGATW